MRPGALRGASALTRDAFADASRRRITIALAAVSLVTLLAIDSCTSCAAPEVTVGGREVELPVSAWGGLVLYTVLCLWTVALAGVLAADQLAEPLADGSATLALARPVGRTTFALTRLAGVLGLALGAGAVLLGATAALLHARHGLPVGPALGASAACALSAVCVASLSMAASLALPRLAATLLVLAAVAAIAGINVASLVGAELGGALGAIDRFGPPLCTAVAKALGPWIDPTRAAGEAPELALRLALWAGASVTALVTAFRRVELR